MLRIRDAQLSAMASARRETFENQVAERMRQLWPEDANRMGEAAFADLVRDGIAMAQKYGILGDREICRFVNIRFGAGLDFPNAKMHRWAFLILESAIPPAEKNDCLLKRLVESVLD